MRIDKILFDEDIRGMHGEVAQNIAIEHIQKYLDYDYTPDEVDELAGAVEELREDYDEIDKENDALRDKVIALEDEIKLLAKENDRLKKENYSIGNLPDYVVIEKGIIIFDEGLQP